MNARLPETAKKIDSIRIDTGAKRIEVNDEGEYITLNFADQSLPHPILCAGRRFPGEGARIPR